MENGTAVVVVTFSLDIQDFAGSSNSQTQDVAFLMVLVEAEGEFLVSEIVDCSDGSGNSATDFSDLGSVASC